MLYRRLILSVLFLMSHAAHASNTSEFINELLPAINSVNHTIQQDRTRLALIQNKTKKNQAITPQERAFITQLASQYHAKNPLSAKSSSAWTDLKKRVDVIPPSLALAQAANESAWGKSRFARQGHNYFGQWCYKPGCGIVPKQRAKGAKHEVRRFNTSAQSVRSYIQNLNSNRAYNHLRDLRFSLRTQDKPLQGRILAQGLSGYSARGQQYVQSIQKIISRYHLEKHTA